MKKDILSHLGLKMNRREDELIEKFHAFSDLIKDALSGIPTLQDNPIIHMDPDGKVFVWICVGTHYEKKELEWLDHIMSLIALWKQKKTPSETLQHERRLGMYRVVNKTKESLAEFEERLKKHWFRTEGSTQSWWNHLLPLYYAYTHICQSRYFFKEDKVILLGLVFTYLSLNNIPPWLVFDDDLGKEVEWDELISTHFQHFDAQKFWKNMESKWYVRIPQDIFENFIAFSREKIQQFQKPNTSLPQWGIYTDNSSSNAMRATNTMLIEMNRIMKT